MKNLKTAKAERREASETALRARLRAKWAEKKARQRAAKAAPAPQPTQSIPAPEIEPTEASVASEHDALGLVFIGSMGNRLERASFTDKWRVVDTICALTDKQRKERRAYINR
jgi:hypothetical protein